LQRNVHPNYPFFAIKPKTATGEIHMDATSVNLHSNNNGELIQLVNFSLDGEEYGVEVLKVREIIRMSNITRVPNTLQYVEGVINLRGKVIPVISLRKRFSLDIAENDNRTRIIVMEFTNELTGFIVDSVVEVIRISAAEIQPPPSIIAGSIDQEYLTGVINREDRLLVLLNVEKLFSFEERQRYSVTMVE
jgi:purine-binding chemotaxis protein CheW